MENSKNKIRNYWVQEISKKGKTIYMMDATEKEISEHCRMKNEFYGYIEGLGGDKSYSCIAWLATPYAMPRG